MISLRVMASISKRDFIRLAHRLSWMARRFAIDVTKNPESLAESVVFDVIDVVVDFVKDLLRAFEGDAVIVDIIKNCTTVVERKMKTTNAPRYQVTIVDGSVHGNLILGNHGYDAANGVSILANVEG